MEFVRAQGRRGAIDQEITEALNICESSCRARRNELMKAHKVVDSGRERATHSGRPAIVWTMPEYAISPGPPIDRPATNSAVSAERVAWAELGAGESCPKCGGRRFVDVKIHGGLSIRRDCAACRAFVRFLVWNNKPVTPRRPGGAIARRLGDDEPAT